MAAGGAPGRRRGRRRSVGRSGGGTLTGNGQAALGRRDRAFLWVVVATGFVLPWTTGAGVKLLLQARGEPTWPWSAFLGPVRLSLEVLLSAIFALPFIALALLGRAVLRGGFRPLRNAGPRERRVFVLAGYLGGAAGVIHVFWHVFVQFDPTIFLFAPLIAALYVPHMAGGLAVGYFICRRSWRSRERPTIRGG